MCFMRTNFEKFVVLSTLSTFLINSGTCSFLYIIIVILMNKDEVILMGMLLIDILLFLVHVLQATSLVYFKRFYLQ